MIVFRATSASGTAPMFGMSMPVPGMMNSQQAAVT